MVESLVAQRGGLDEDAEILHNLLLAVERLETPRTEGLLDVAVGSGGLTADVEIVAGLAAYVSFFCHKSLFYYKVSKSARYGQMPTQSAVRASHSVHGTTELSSRLSATIHSHFLLEK